LIAAFAAKGESMKSLRDTARKAGITDVPLSTRSLAQRSGLTAPVSLTALIGALEASPATGGRIEEAKFRQQILTPTGTSLGGAVDLTLRSDGSYAAHFHLRDSGAADYDYQARAIFTAANGLAFAMQQSGSVEGTSLNPFHKPRRNDDHDITGTHPFIKDYWNDVKAGRLNVTKEYSPTGVIGVVQDIASIVLEIASHTAGAGLGVVIGLGHEMGKVLGDLGIVGGFTIMAGAVVFAFGGAMVLALPVGVAVGAVTNALIKQRQIATHEYAFANRVFNNQLPPASKIWLTNLSGIGDRAFTIPGFDNGNIYLNIGDAYDNPLGPAKHYPMNAQLLIHELTHSWQIQHNTFIPGVVCQSVVNQARNEFGGSVYKYGPPGQPWSKFNLEQQASIVDDWFAGTRPGSSGIGMDTTDPYFMYIRDNIQTGRT
jgi:hypothetical protein